jgi:hypothetical protein
MLNALAIGLYLIVSHRGRSAPFLVGFEICGLMTTLVYMAWVWRAPTSVWETLGSKPVLYLWHFWSRGRITLEGLLLLGPVVLSTPQLLIASLGGLLTRLAVRRRRPAGAGSDK